MNDEVMEIDNVQVMPAISDNGAVERAVIDCQIATAHQYPRSLEKFKKTALGMVTLDEETAASCLYKRPVGDGKFAEGKSIRMAEIVGASYGNFRVSAQIIEQTDRFVKARGIAHDLESNFATSTEVIESTVTKKGHPYSERMRITVAKACVAKARRDATFQVIPAALCKSLEDAARKTAVGDADTLVRRRGAVMNWIKKLGIDVKRVFAAVGIRGEGDIGLDELETLTGIKTAIFENDTSIAEAFPVIEVTEDKKDLKPTSLDSAEPLSKGDKAKAAAKAKAKAKADAKAKKAEEDAKPSGKTSENAKEPAKVVKTEEVVKTKEPSGKEGGDEDKKPNPFAKKGGLDSPR